ncbi:MAG TPA: MoaD/ThiS family protein [Candidatus Nanoarchaeia archaeon]|nr:MoaD/ThiS family protein [Candidatus Nanoarchaeia archaeon]
MRVFLEKSKEEKEVNAVSVKELLKVLKLNPTTVLVVANGRLVTEDAPLRKEDEVKILSVVSGG